MNGEEHALYGFVKQHDSYASSLLPTNDYLAKYFSHWMADCSLILRILERIKERIAELLGKNPVNQVVTSRCPETFCLPLFTYELSI